jgi:hypothetical protein
MIFLRLVSCILLGLLLVATPVLAQAPRPIATITQLKLGKRGVVNLHLPNGKKQKAEGFVELYPGTKIEVSNDALVEVYFFGADSQRLTSKEPTFTVEAPTTNRPQASSQLVELVRVWTDRRRASRQVDAQIRAGAVALIVKAPRRDTKLMTKWPRFQWEGEVNAAATLKVTGPEGEVWSVKNLPPEEIQYPQTAPALMPGVYYSWYIDLDDTKYSGGRFQVLTDREASSVKTRLAEIESQSDLGQATRRVLQISLLISQQLYYDARERLIEALRADGDEPTLRLLLAEVYEKTGLRNLAHENVQIASDLAARNENR